MKLPVEVGGKLFFRALFPGAVLTAFLFRATETMLSLTGFKAGLTPLLVIEILALGFLFVALDMQIYMLFEGRRFWPRRGWRFGLKQERRRLLAVHRKMRAARAASSVGDRYRRADANRAYLEAAVELSHFPINPKTGMPQAVWPTQLGNLIGAFEQYPTLKYGMDSVFYWPRLWMTISEELRGEVDKFQSQVDGFLYATSALLLGALVMLTYAAVDWWSPGAIVHAVHFGWDLAGAVLAVIGAYGLYRISLPSQAQFGEIFKAVFDQHRSDLKLDEVVAIVADYTNSPAPPPSQSRLRNITVWRFLRWHRVRFAGETRNRRVKLT